MESIIHGIIVDQSYGDEDELRMRRWVNQSAVSRLPRVDQWPFLTRGMFRIPEESTGSMFKSQVIHFAASLCAVEKDWQIWVEKFEKLLGAMFWTTARVHLITEEFGQHQFTWQSHQDYHSPNQEGLAANREWSREGVLDFV